MEKLYFENVSGIGNLYLDYSLFEFEAEPILFLCVNEAGKIYLCLCSDIRYEQRWVIVPCGISVLKQMINEKMDIATAFINSKEVVVITRDIQGKERSCVKNIDEIDRLDLPKEGTYIRGDKEKFLNYLWKKELDFLLVKAREGLSAASAVEEIKKSYMGSIDVVMPYSNSQMGDFICEAVVATKETIDKEKGYSINRIEKYMELVEEMDISNRDSDYYSEAA